MRVLARASRKRLGIAVGRRQQRKRPAPGPPRLPFASGTDPPLAPPPSLTFSLPVASLLSGKRHVTVAQTDVSVLADQAVAPGIAAEAPQASNFPTSGRVPGCLLLAELCLAGSSDDPTSSDGVHPSQRWLSWSSSFHHIRRLHAR